MSYGSYPSYLSYIFLSPTRTIDARASANSASASGESVGIPGVAANTVIAAVLSASPGSTCAVFDTVPGVDGRVTTRSMVDEFPAVSVPIVHVIVVVPVQLPGAETRVVPAGSSSVTTTFIAVPGPLFVTTIV